MDSSSRCLPVSPSRTPPPYLNVPVRVLMPVRIQYSEDRPQLNKFLSIRAVPNSGPRPSFHNELASQPMRRLHLIPKHGTGGAFTGFDACDIRGSVRRRHGWPTIQVCVLYVQYCCTRGVPFGRIDVCTPRRTSMALFHVSVWAGVVLNLDSEHSRPSQDTLVSVAR